VGPPLLPCEVSARRLRRQDSACRRLHPRKVRTKSQASACFRHELAGPSVPQRFWREKQSLCSGLSAFCERAHTRRRAASHGRAGNEAPRHRYRSRTYQALRLLIVSPPFRRAIGRLGHCPDSDPTEGPTEGPTESARVSIPGRAANSPPSSAGGDWRDPADEKRHRARGTIGRRWSSPVGRADPSPGETRLARKDVRFRLAGPSYG